MSLRPLTEPYIDATTLPANIASISQPSKPIERLLTKRENGHNSTINSMELKCQKYSLEIEEEIEQESERFKENMEKARNEIENELAILRRGQEEILNLNMGVFQSALATVQNDQRLEMIDDFHKILQNLEKKRSKYFKSVLNEGYSKTSKLNHVLPYELLNFFETKMTRMNEITLNNYSHYARLHQELKLQVQEEIRVRILEITEAKDKYKMAVKMAKVKEVLDAHKAEETKLPELNLSSIDPKFVADVPRTVMDVEMWSRDMKTTLNHLDANARKLVSLYKMAVVHVFNRFFDELQNITRVITEDEEKTELSLDDVDDEVYKTIVDDFTDIYKCDFADLQHLWNDITNYMETNINNTYLFLNSSAHLWDAHFNRIADIRNLMMQDLKLLIDKHDKAAQDFDKRVHITLDKLRQESTVVQLDKYLKEANKFLDSIEKLYEKQCEAEIKLLSKYNSTIDQSTELLISEIDRFLCENADQKKMQEMKSFSSQPGTEPTEDPREKLIPDEMKVCQFEVEAVNNWMFGLWETIRQYMSTCHKELSEQAQQLMDKTITKLKKRLQVRLATHKPRYLRIKTMIYDVRLKELQDHMDDFYKIEERVQQYLSDSKRTNQILNEDRLLVFEEYEQVMRGIEAKLKKAAKSQHVAACIEQSKTCADETREKLNESLRVNYEQLERNLDNVNKLICSFGSSIRLFPEGGNYSQEEAKIFAKKIKKLKKGAPKKCKKVFAELDIIATQILHSFEETVTAILERMEVSQKEFVHNEAACEKIKDLRSKIRNYAYEIKYRIHRIDADVDYYEDVSNINIWKKKQFDIMKNTGHECVNNIIEMTDFLTVGDSSGRSYLFELDSLIKEYYEEIEKTAKKFYANHGPIINAGKIQTKFGGFMKEVKKICDGFGIQVEIHCLQCLEDLIRHVLRFLRVNDAVYEGLVKKFPTSQEDEELGKKLEKESSDLEERRSYLEKAEEVPKDVAVTEIILKNEDRVNALNKVILKIMERVRKKVEVMEEFVQEGGEDEECFEN